MEHDLQHIPGGSLGVFIAVRHVASRNLFLTHSVDVI